MFKRGGVGVFAAVWLTGPLSTAHSEIEKGRPGSGRKNSPPTKAPLPASVVEDSAVCSTAAWAATLSPPLSTLALSRLALRAAFQVFLTCFLRSSLVVFLQSGQ